MKEKLLELLEKNGRNAEFDELYDENMSVQQFMAKHTELVVMRRMG